MSEKTTQELKRVEISKIRLNPYQPRQIFGLEELEELAQSIQTVGVLQPPTVRALKDLEGTFELITGERRIRAAQLAGLKQVPVVIVTDNENRFSAEAALIENIQRVDLNPLDIAKGLCRLIEEFGYLQEELAKRVGKKRSTVANYLRLLSLPDAIQEGLEQSRITMGHAKALLSVASLEDQLFLFQKIEKERLSVRQAEELSQKICRVEQKKTAKNDVGDCFLRSIQEQMQQKFGTKVLFQGDGKKGRISLDYYSPEDLDRLLRLLGFTSEEEIIKPLRKI